MSVHLETFVPPAVQQQGKNLQPGQDQLGVTLMADHPEVDPGIVLLPLEVGVAGVVNRKVHEKMIECYASL